VTEVTGLFDLSSWPPGMRLIVRKERPHPGAQPRITDCTWPPLHPSPNWRCRPSPPSPG
jgi:hypothetical protein